MKTIGHLLNSEKGSVIVAAVMILALLTIIGFAASNMSTTELNISTNSLLYEKAFYAAEAGLQHAKESLRAPFVVNNQAQLASGGTGDWSFALINAADDPNDDLPGVPIVRWIQEDSLNGVRYTVRIWDNNDGNGPTADDDGLIWVRADAWEPVRGGRCSIVELVRGSSTSGGTSGYTAQEGLGSGKGFISDDASAIDFTDPEFGEQI